MSRKKQPTPLETVLSKYRDRTKDEERETAGADWEVFQSLSVEDSRLIGGEEDTTHLVKGLDFDLLRKQRQRSVVLEKPLEPLLDAKPVSREISSLHAALFPPIVSREEFFHSSTYVFNETGYSILIKEANPQSSSRIAYDPEFVKLLSESLKKKKRIVDQIDDFDIFDLPQKVHMEDSERNGPLFELDDIAYHSVVRIVAPRQEEEDGFGKFGMDLSKFGDDIGETKKRKKNDKKLLQEVMKRVNDR